MKDPAFLFYPGDYLRDTQCLSEKSQVAYDRIMCEHMRNICISKQQVDFFTKKLSDEEKKELLFVLIENNEGYQIGWVAESILKRRLYSDSRRNNRIKNKTTHDKHMLSHDKHMEIENENVIENINKDKIEDLKNFSKQFFKEKYITDEIFDKLLRIDKFSVEQIKNAITNGVKDSFWVKQFQSPTKLRNKNKDGVMYIDVFLNLKSENNTSQNDLFTYNEAVIWCEKNKGTLTISDYFYVTDQKNGKGKSYWKMK